MSHNSVVLLATYNGEKYIRDLISSIDAEVDIIVFDDCSSDGTISVLESIERENISISISPSRSGSAVNNFTNLISSAPLSYEYYFIADQDDIWCQGKVSKVLEVMRAMELEFGLDTPFLVFSDAKVVDENLECIASSFWKYERLNPDFSKELKLLCVQNVGQGATMVFNRAYLNKIRPITDRPIMHDWWLMLCASAFGYIGYTREKTILYRQHRMNQVGAKNSSLLALARMFFLQREVVLRSIRDGQWQAGVFLDRYRDSLSHYNIEFLEEYSNLNSQPFIKRKFFCFKHRLRKSSLFKTIGFYLLV